MHPKHLYGKKGRVISWSARLKDALRQINSKYVIILLDDFFLKSPVRSDVIEKCIAFMEQNDDAVAFKFFTDPGLGAVVCDEFVSADPDFCFCVSAMATLWRKEFLIELLRDENPWDFEFYASARWRNKYRKTYKMYVQNTGKPVFDYIYYTPKGGWSAILRGKWLITVPEFFEQYGLEVDYEKRGFIDPSFETQSIHQANGLRNDLVDMIRHPTRIVHYTQCAGRIIYLQLKRLKSKYFNP